MQRRGGKRVVRFALWKVRRWWGQKRDGEGTAPRTYFFFLVRKRDGGGCCASRQLKGLERRVEPASVCGSGNVVVGAKRKV
jgi:hypothetical protein